MGSAFTTYNSDLVNKLNNEIVISYNGKSMIVKALWDTGATMSCISEEVVSNLSLASTGKIGMKTPSGQAERNTYIVNLKLPNDVIINDLVVADSEIGAQNIGLLVGMDIINRGDFAVSNFNNKTLFTFRISSEGRIDYTIEQKISNLIGPMHGKGKRKRK